MEATKRAHNLAAEKLGFVYRSYPGVNDPVHEITCLRCMDPDLTHWTRYACCRTQMPWNGRKTESFIDSCYTYCCISCLLINILATRAMITLRPVCSGLPAFSAGKSDESEGSNLKFCVVKQSSHDFFSTGVVNPSLTSFLVRSRAFNIPQSKLVSWSLHWKQFA